MTLLDRYERQAILVDPPREVPESVRQMLAYAGLMRFLGLPQPEMFDAHANFAYSTVLTAPSPASSGTSLVVQSGDGAKFPAVPFNATVWPAGSQPTTANAEIVRVTARSTDTLTITRAQESSSARAVVVGDQIAATITKKTVTDIESPIADGWVDDSAETWTYASGSGGGVATFTVSGDVTAKYTVGTRIKLTQTTVKYFVVSAAPSFSGGNTTVTIMAGSDYTLANAAISANFHSYAANPQGYPGWFNFAPAFTGFSSKTSDLGRFAVSGRTCFVQYLGQGTSNATTLGFTLPIAMSANALTGRLPVRVTDSGSIALSPGSLDLIASGTTATIDASLATSNGFTASGTKGSVGYFIYEI